MITNADAGLRWLDRPTPDLDEAKAAFKQIVADGHRAGAVIGSIRTIFKRDARSRTSLDINDLIGEALVLLRGDLQKHRILVQTEADAELPQVAGDRIQLQQVLLNLITNAIESMADEDGPRILAVKCEVQDGGVMVSVAGYRSWNRRARCRSDIQPAVHDKIERHGDGPVDLPFDHRGPRWTVVGHARHAARHGVSICPARRYRGVDGHFSRREQDRARCDRLRLTGYQSLRLLVGEEISKIASI
jgi:hypothetical protein